MIASPATTEALASRTQRQVAQIFLCRGCCCGQTERGFPAVPVERIKARWKAEKLNRSVQLTVSGCLGPCDVPNVVLVLTAAGPEWFANIVDDSAYDALVEWARRCQASKRALPLPAEFDAHRLERFRAPLSSIAAENDAGEIT
ncbi:MAG TPA: (2Fe-2S) ferredoxin domain-containing protein [Pirellulales bacterium]|jgi:cobaltochelatase CobN|nr:(2Fe-2S) ferredoxin domain-containing protein [Pirellulales bacterium]